MIQITDKSRCCGCEACVKVCPKHCISFKQDHEGFFYPEANADICIQCGLCEKVCPVLHPYDEQKPLEVLAAINKDEEVRMESSSGGLFTLLSEKIISQGGAVFGVRFDEQWQAVFDCAETTGELAAFRGSKYIQARVGNSYARCKQYLDNGRQVLFSGTPCQIAGLNHFLRKTYPNLITVDIICHGVPSPKVWSKYLEELENCGMRVIRNINFRDKHNGWKKFCFNIDFDKQGKTSSWSCIHNKDSYMRAFLWDLILRPSCYACKAKSGRSQADYTIGDFWGIQYINSKLDDDKGTSVVMLNSNKAKTFFPFSDVYFSEVLYEEAIIPNPAVYESAKIPHHRNSFFVKLDTCLSLHQLIMKSLRPSFINILNSYLHRIIKKLYC